MLCSEPVEAEETVLHVCMQSVCVCVRACGGNGGCNCVQLVLLPSHHSPYVYGCCHHVKLYINFHHLK